MIAHQTITQWNPNTSTNTWQEWCTNVDKRWIHFGILIWSVVWFKDWWEVRICVLSLFVYLCSCVLVQWRIVWQWLILICRFLGCIDLYGTTWQAPSLATGFGAYIAQPLLRAALEKHERKGIVPVLLVVVLFVFLFLIIFQESIHH